MIVEFEDVNSSVNVVNKRWSKPLDFEPEVIQNITWRICRKYISKILFINLRSNTVDDVSE